jgi:hypothetical protein
MPKSDDEREDPVRPSTAKTPTYLVERLAPRSGEDPAVMFGWRLLQLIAVIAVIFVIFHFLQKYW